MQEAACAAYTAKFRSTLYMTYTHTWDTGWRHIDQLVFFETLLVYQPMEWYIPKNRIFSGEQKCALVFSLRVRWEKAVDVEVRQIWQ